MNQIIDFLSVKFWVVEVFLVVFAALILSYFERRTYRHLYKKLLKTSKSWDDVLLFSLHQPLYTLIWFLGIVFAAKIVASKATDVFIFRAIKSIQELGIILFLVWFIIRFIQQIEHHIIHKAERLEDSVDPTTVQALSQLFRISVLITAGLVTLQILGIPISGVLAFGGVGALAVGLAARDLLANFFGGLMIFLDRPFRIGDWVRSPDKEIEGTVEHIGWRLTRIRTFDKRPLYVPNAIFSTISLENPSRMRNRRIKTVVGLRYADANKVETILNAIEDMLRHHPEIDTRQTLFVKLIEFGASSLDFLIYTFTKTTDWVKFQGIQQDVFLKVLTIIEEHGAECAFPTRSVHLYKEEET